MLPSFDKYIIADISINSIEYVIDQFLIFRRHKFNRELIPPKIPLRFSVEIFKILISIFRYGCLRANWELIPCKFEQGEESLFPIHH
jgi:hypothetical protein